MKPKIGIVNSSSFGRTFPEVLKKIEEFSELSRVDLPSTAKPEEVIDKLTGLNGIVLGISPNISKEVLEALPDLILISRHGIGFDHVDIKTATDLGVIVSTIPGPIERTAMAEHTIALILSVSRYIVPAANAVLGGRWEARASFIGSEISGKRVGIIGLGNIGGRVSEILSKGFNAEIVAYDPNIPPEGFAQCGAKKSSLEDLLRSADIISLHASLNPSTIHLLNKDRIGLIKNGALLINAARGELVESDALISVLDNGRLAGYAADAFEEEPINPKHPLLSRKNVLILPHIGAYTRESLFGMSNKVVQDLVDVFIDGALPKNIINPNLNKDRIKRWI